MMIKPTGKPAWSRDASIENYGGHLEKQSIQDALATRLASLPMNADGSFDALTSLECFFLSQLIGYANASRENQKGVALMHLSHAVFWTRALDERFEKDLASGYDTFRKSHKLGPIIRGIRYARNRVVHQFPELFYVTDGSAAFPLEMPAMFFEYRWRPRASLPAPDPNYPDHDGASAYEQHLENHPVRHALRAADHFFMEARYQLIQGGKDAP
jgi:hypothetical protein